MCSHSINFPSVDDDDASVKRTALTLTLAVRVALTLNDIIGPTSFFQYILVLNLIIMAGLHDKIRDVEAAQPLQFNDFKTKEFFVPGKGVFYHGLSSAYDTTYIDDLRGILSPDEFVGIVSRLNEIIENYWPCNPCVTFGYVCYPCSFLPCFPTRICIVESEKHALEYLGRTNVRSLYFDR